MTVCQLDYKGFHAQIMFCAKTRVYYGEVFDSENLVSFQFEVLHQAQDRLATAIEIYLAYKINLFLEPCDLT